MKGDFHNLSKILFSINWKHHTRVIVLQQDCTIILIKNHRFFGKLKALKICLRACMKMADLFLNKFFSYFPKMKKKAFSDLTKEEIGKLFPIEISPYDSNWPKLYEQEKQLIEKEVNPSLFSRIEHFGSTSVPGLSAKNTIDIL